FAPLLARFRASGEANDPDAEFLFALLDRTTEAYASFQKRAANGEPDLAVIVARGTYSPEDITRLEQSMSSTHTRIEHGPFSLHCDVQACASLVGTHTLVV